MGAYKGSVPRKRSTSSKVGFDWKALGLWLLSIVISLIPVYITILNQIRLGKPLGTEFWFECYGEYDVLWVFGTVLLLCCFNIFSKNSSTKQSGKTLAVVGLVFFAFLEATWLCFKYLNFENTTPEGLARLVALGNVLIIVAVLISTPLQVNFIKSEGK